MAITIEHRVYTKGDKTALLSITENTVLTIINDESKLCESAQEAHLKLLTLGYKKTDTIIENAPVAPVPDKKYIKGTPEHKANKESKKKFKTEEAELDEAASPIAGTRLVKKYGSDEHRAEVRYNPDYQEYQVHHYKDGKHMGEGPVSYHGDDKQDAHDTAKSEVAKRSTKSESYDGTGEKVDHKTIAKMKEVRKRIADAEAKDKEANKETVKEDLNEESDEFYKKAAAYHAKEGEWHMKKAGKEPKDSEKGNHHAIAATKHNAAAHFYTKAADAKHDKEYHAEKAYNHADAAEEHERKHNLMENLEEAHKLGDKVMIHKGSMSGTVGHIGEIRPGMFKGAPKTYTVDYSEPGKESRQSVQVKKEHIKAIKEDTQIDEISKKVVGNYVGALAQKQLKAQGGLKPNMYGKLEPKHQKGFDRAIERLKEDLNEDQKDSITMDIPLLIRVLELVRENIKDDADLHRIVEKLIAIRDRGTLTMDDYNYVAAIKEELEISEEQLDELKQSTLASYTQKAAGSMANAAFGQGQASAQYKEPQEKDTKLFSKRLKGIGTATAKLAKEDLDESRNQADKYWDKAEEHKAEANKNKSNPEKFHAHMSMHHDSLANYHSDLGQSSSAERHSRKSQEHHEKSLQASDKGLAEATVATKKYSWGTMKTIHQGADFSIPLHPEHHQAIAKLKDEQEHKFKDETGRHWTARRKGEDVHFQSANQGNSTTVKHSTMTEAVIDPEDKRNPDIPTYLRKQQGQKPLSYAEVKARSTKNVDAYRKRAGVLEDIEEAEELDEGGLWANIHAKRKRIKAGSGERMRKPGSEGAPTDASLKAASESNEIFPELASIVESNTGSSVMFKNGETSDVSPDHANALINLHGMLSDENKQKLAEYAHHSMGNFSKVVDWALTKIK